MKYSSYWLWFVSDIRLSLSEVYVSGSDIWVRFARW